MIDDVTISVRIDHLPFSVRGQPQHLRYNIGMEQARDLAIGRCPPDFDMMARVDWLMRRERAGKLAQLIAADLAHKLVRAFNPNDT